MPKTISIPSSDPISRPKSLGFRRLIYRAAVRLKRPNTTRYLKYLKSQERLSLEDGLANQKFRLKSLLVHASQNIPYYREILAECGVLSSSGEIRIDRFRDTPLLGRDTIHERFEDLKSNDIDRREWYQNSSGGSTGEPVQFIQDLDFRDWSRAVGMLFEGWAGYRAGDPKFLVWSVHRDLPGERVDLMGRLEKIIRNETWLDARRMTPEQMQSFLDRIHEVRPALVYAFPENLYELGRFALDNGQRINPPEAIMTSAAMLHPWMRSTIEAAFGTRVLDRYGSREVDGVACECKAHAGLHVCLPTQYVEILRKDGSPTDPGEIGEVVVTPLISRAMPMIRYQIGDLAAWAGERCSCGRSWPLLQEVAGRTPDIFRKRDGTMARIRVGFFRRFDWVRQFQVIQEDYEFVRALIVPHDGFDRVGNAHAADIAQIEESIRQAMGSDCSVEVVLTARIEPSPSGKHRHHISLVQ